MTRILKKCKGACDITAEIQCMGNPGKTAKSVELQNKPLTIQDKNIET